MKLHELKELHIKTNEILDRVYEELKELEDMKPFYKEVDDRLATISESLNEIKLQLKLKKGE